MDPDFQAFFDFKLDDFQLEAIAALDENKAVLVAAPTGSGKTVVGEYAVHLAITNNTRAFYTTPIKALSNQKYRDLVERYSEAEVGLLTGDSSVNGDAPIIVMTTEILRNMLYENSDALEALSHVVMDEVHYLADRSRGAVWEEVILHLPDPVKLVALSATVSNAEEFGAWMGAVRGEVEIIVEESRPVPLDQHVMTKRDLVPLFQAGSSIEGQYQVDNRMPSKPQVNKDLLRLRANEDQAARMRGSAVNRRGGKGRSRGPKNGRGGQASSGGGKRDSRRANISGFVPRVRVIEKLDREGLLPAIVFIFSRNGCDQAVQQCLRSPVRLTSDDDVLEIRALVDEKCQHIPDEDLGVLNYYEWRSALERGVAAHHAGLLPIFKETVEELFTRGLVKVVYATETLALGINMPARSVVVERFVKWNGQAHVELSPGQYTQLIGRAGRRGIDNQGHAVAVWHSELDPQTLAGLATTRTYPLKSSFQPSYNMAVNLISRIGIKEAKLILEKSFAQYQTVIRGGRYDQEMERNRESLEGYREAIESSSGDAQIRWKKRYHELDRRNRKLTRRVSNQSSSISRQLDDTCLVLSHFGFIEGSPESYTVTNSGRLLRRIYGDQDLLTALALQEGVFDNLNADELVGVCAAIVYESRKDSVTSKRVPYLTEKLGDSLESLLELSADVAEAESRYGLNVTKRPSLEFVKPAFAWASGDSLDVVLQDLELSPGDFVRWCRQLIDLLGQIAHTSHSPELANIANTASDQMQHGVVTYTSWL